MAKMGRRPKTEEWLTEEGLLKLEGWARDGLTDEQIAANMGIGTSTLYRWKNKHREIREALKKGKDAVDREVENALLRRALGYTYKEEAVTNKGEVVEITRYEPPNVTAIIFWLKNRKPDVWRDKQDINLKGGVNQKVVVRFGGEKPADPGGDGG